MRRDGKDQTATFVASIQDAKMGPARKLLKGMKSRGLVIAMKDIGIHETLKYLKNGISFQIK